jgi:hypothetical protein
MTFAETAAVMRLVNASRDQFTESTLASLFLVDDYDALLYQCQTINISEDVSFIINDPTMFLLLLEHPASFSLSHEFFIKAFAHMRKSKTLEGLLVKRWNQGSRWSVHLVSQRRWSVQVSRHFRSSLSQSKGLSLTPLTKSTK